MNSRISTISIVVVILVTCVTLVLFTSVGRALSSSVYEDLSLVFNPSAERAYEYGNRHFDAIHPDVFNIDRAEHLFKKAYEIDPSQPYVQHQLARIAFLKSDFNAALDLINAEIAAGPPSLSSYYIRALIRGYMDDFAGSAADYEIYLKEDPRNWAAINDYAWVLIKQGRHKDALVALDWGLLHHVGNPWLLNSKATALFELGRIEPAKETIDLAARSVASVTEELWMQAYPGNDPLIAKEGVDTFKKSVEENMHTISIAFEERVENMQ
jgi:tetratricopeptide (TPR) repeat protein